MLIFTLSAIAFILLLFTGSIVYLLFSIKKETNSKTKSQNGIFLPNPRITVYEKDAQYLNHIIKQKCEYIIYTKLYPMSESNGKKNILNDDILLESTKETTVLVLQNVSIEYKNTMNYYMGNLEDYVTKTIYFELLKATRELNLKSINNMSRNK